MNILAKYSTVIASLLVANTALAQNPLNADRANSQAAKKEYVNQEWQPSLVPDGMIDRVNHDNRALQWNNVREIDVAFKRRVWKRLDVKEKQNMPFIYEGDEYTGGGAFVEILIDAIHRGKIRAFSDDKFTRVMSVEDVDKQLMSEKSVIVTDPITGEQTTEISKGNFNPLEVTTYAIQEDWIFDRNVGRMLPRVRAITPMLSQYNDDGTFRNLVPLFTVYYPESRDVLAQYEIYNPENDVRRMTWTDYIDRSYYSAYIIKTSHNNPENANFKGGFDGLIQGQKEMEDIISKEMDMWEL